MKYVFLYAYQQVSALQQPPLPSGVEPTGQEHIGRPSSLGLQIVPAPHGLGLTSHGLGRTKFKSLHVLNCFIELYL